MKLLEHSHPELKFLNIHFSHTVSKKLDNRIKKTESLAKFKTLLLSFIKSKSRSIFSVYEQVGIKFLTRLRLGFSQLNEHKF